MKYIIYEYIAAYMFQPARYERHELKTDKELKEFLFNAKLTLKYI